MRVFYQGNVAYLCHFSSFSSSPIFQFCHILCGFARILSNFMKTGAKIYLCIFMYQNCLNKAAFQKKGRRRREKRMRHKAERTKSLHSVPHGFSVLQPPFMLFLNDYERSSIPSVFKPFRIFSIAAFTSASASVLSFARKLTE